MNIIMIPRINIYIIKILVIIIIFSTIYQWNSLFNDNDSNKTLLYDDELDDVSPNDTNLERELLDDGKFDEVLTTEKRKRLFFMMECIHNVFKKHGIWYVISFGTLLGAVRHWDKIPWDDDMDIIIRRRDLPKINEALKDIEKLGLRTDQTWKLFKVYADDTEDLFIDIFVVDVNKDGDVARCYTDSSDKCVELPRPSDWWHKWWGFPKEYLGQRKKYVFGYLKLWGPKNPLRLLQFWYGKNVLSECSTPIYDHHTGKYLNPTIVKCPSDYPQPQL